MADPQTPEELSSYSDPLYDRMEGIANRLGQRWWLYVIAVILAVVIAFVMRDILGRSPDAAAHHRYQTAADTEALIDLSRDESMTAEFRVHAAIEAAQDLLLSGEIDEAEALIRAAGPLATSSRHESRSLSLVKDLSLAAVHEEVGEFETALTLYQGVESRAGRQLPIHTILGGLGAARIQQVQAGALRATAQAEDDPQRAASLNQEADTLHEQAVRGLESLADLPPTALEDLVRYRLLLARIVDQAETTRGPGPDADTAEANPEPAASAWRCQDCGHVHQGETPPDACPQCGAPATAFDVVAAPPSAADDAAE